MSATVWLVTLLVLGLILAIDLLIAIINRHKPLTLETIKVFKKELNIPAEVFI